MIVDLSKVPRYGGAGWLRIAAAAKATGVPRATIDHWIKTGAIKARRVRVGRYKQATFTLIDPESFAERARTWTPHPHVGQGKAVKKEPEPKPDGAKRGRGRPRKNPHLDNTVATRPVGRPRKFPRPVYASDTQTTPKSTPEPSLAYD